MPDRPAMKLPLVITGTIVPQANFVHIKDWQLRRGQYLEALRFFCKEYTVFFLENSAYDIEADNGFEMDRLTVVKLRNADDCHDFGKGYQEFRMLDQFLSTDQAPPRFMKISGRRILIQIDYFQATYARSRWQYFDLWQNDGFADTSFFCCDLAFYKAHLLGIYAQANDSAGAIIEKLAYQALAKASNVRFHPVTPLYKGQHGTSGNRLKSKYHIPTELRRFFRRLQGKTKMDKRIFDPRKLN